MISLFSLKLWWISSVKLFNIFMKVTQLCLTLVTPWTIQSMELSRPDTGVASLSLLQGIFPTQGLYPDFPHCRWILYQLSHKRSPGIREWVAYPFSSKSSWPRSWTRVSCIVGRFSTYWVIRQEQYFCGKCYCYFNIFTYYKSIQLFSIKSDLVVCVFLEICVSSVLSNLLT